MDESIKTTSPDEAGIPEFIEPEQPSMGMCEDCPKRTAQVIRLVPRTETVKVEVSTHNDAEIVTYKAKDLFLRVMLGVLVFFLTVIVVGITYTNLTGKEISIPKWAVVILEVLKEIALTLAEVLKA